ncbi:TetR/AcrR family transcriptional regulator [Herpetosiphon llansteffanensis]|uniref:TetR/AcrR family transcriptional regulator n=1 Tax=Herpetosiphon llansteffanensis TaxID=2094568 RepID=UPI000D7BE204|nr:TetR/AcrR family transcriptional regulator [Herpetosiphon llansteffanensis]
MSTKAEARQRQILAAAASCFARKGFHQTTMDDICREVQLSPGSVYRYYRSKEAIIAAFVEDDSRDLSDLLQHVSQQADLWQGLDWLIDQLLAAISSPLYAELSAEIGAETMHNPAIAALVRQNDQANLQALIEVLRLAQQRGQLGTSLDLGSAANLIIALIDGLTWRKGLYPDQDLNIYATSTKSMIKQLLSA